MKKEKTIGVITGDLIHSSELSEKQKAALKAALEDFTKNSQYVLLPLQFYRGDSFQLMCTKEKAAWLAIIIQAIIISKTNTMARLSIGIGKTSRIAEKDVLQSEGEAFILSGHQLDDMKSKNRIFKVAINNDEIQANMEITTLLTENIMMDWKQGQASVIAMNPQGETQRAIADKLNISPAAVSKTLKACKWTAIDQYLIWFENTVKKQSHE